MKIGIITIHVSPNYGATLQAYALYKFLVSQGFDCELIDLHRSEFEDYIPSKRFVRCRPRKVSLYEKFKNVIKKMIGYKTRVVNTKNKYSVEAAPKFKAFNSAIKLSKTYRGIDQLYDDPPVYDVYITGSDQVWNPSQYYCIEPYFLTFVPVSARRISYAASIGISYIRENEKALFAKWLSRYDAISVREKQAKTILSAITNKEITQVSDPTFLLDREYWKSVAVYPSSKDYILIFTLEFNQRMVNYGKRLSQECGKKLFVLAQVQDKNVADGYVPIVDAGPKEWLGYIANASLVLTDSFHCTVFSIIMGTENFYSIIENDRGSRITDLLATFELTDHLLNPALTDSYKELCKNRIDQKAIDNTFTREQKFSRDFLLKNIK